MLHIVTHNNCLDGFTCEWLLHEAYGDDDVTYHRALYNDPIIEIDWDDDVLIADFSYKKDDFMTLCAKARHVVVLDHHKSAIDELGSLVGIDPHVYIKLDVEHAGCELVYNYLKDDYKGKNPALIPASLSTFNTREECLDLIGYIADHDLWKHSLSATEEIHAAIDATPRTYDDWDSISAEMYESRYLVEARGLAVLYYQDNLIEEVLKNVWYFRSKHDGNIYPCVLNVPYSIVSKVCHRLALESVNNAAFYTTSTLAALQTDTPVKWGVRGIGDFDCAAFAQHYGGGGHKGAGGFTATIEEVVENYEFD